MEPLNEQTGSGAAIGVQNSDSVSTGNRRQRKANSQPSAVGVQETSQKAPVVSESTSQAHFETSSLEDSHTKRRRLDAEKKFAHSATQLHELIKAREGTSHQFKVSFDDSDPIRNVANMARELEKAIIEFQEERDLQKESRTRGGKMKDKLANWYHTLYPGVKSLLATGNEIAGVYQNKRRC